MKPQITWDEENKCWLLKCVANDQPRRLWLSEEQVSDLLLLLSEWGCRVED